MTAATVAEKDALVVPAATMTEVGTATAALLLTRPTAKPLLPAAMLSDTVQESKLDPVMEELLHENPFNARVDDCAPV